MAENKSLIIRHLLLESSPAANALPLTVARIFPGSTESARGVALRYESLDLQERFTIRFTFGG